MRNIIALMLVTFIFHVSKFDESLELQWAQRVRVNNCRNVDHAWRTVEHYYPLEDGHSIKLDQQHQGK